jgi:DNA-binding response OmpR family regulator
MIKLALTHAGYEVDTAADGPDGLAKFGPGGAYDLVLLDHRMPGMSGTEVLREIFRREATTKLILITAFGTIDLAMEAIQAGASDFLRKPFTADTLRNAVSSALERAPLPSGSSPVGMVCREFTRSTINGFNFELKDHEVDEASGDVTCKFSVARSDQKIEIVRTILPNYVMELVLAYSDSEEVPGGIRFWESLCEEALANYLWQNAEVPEENVLRIEDLTSSLEKWIDSILTVPCFEQHAVK